jgi:DNA-binding NarL/FixJ family response regulator
MKGRFSRKWLKDIAFLKARGFKNKEIADRKDLNKNTVSRYSKELRNRTAREIEGLLKERIF